MPIQETVNYIGIDQTGALNSRKDGYLSLKVSHFVPGRRPVLRLGSIKKLHPDDLAIMGIDLSRPSIVFIDSVLGLPSPIGFDFVSHFGKAFQEKGKGRLAAEVFFNQILESEKLKDIPTRLCEQRLGANSVFKNRPYQKNIQTGTFRTWQDLGSSFSSVQKPWFELWPHSQCVSKRPILLEGYPSYLWKKIFDQPNRNPKCLAQNLLKKIPELMISDSESKKLTFDAATAIFSKDADLSDAAVLAVGGYLYLKQNPNYLSHQRKLIQKSGLLQEGWIFALDSSH